MGSLDRRRFLKVEKVDEESGRENEDFFLYAESLHVQVGAVLRSVSVDLAEEAAELLRNGRHVLARPRRSHAEVQVESKAPQRKRATTAEDAHDVVLVLVGDGE